LNPNSALSHVRYAEYLKTRLRFSESMAEAQRAQELDPLSPEIATQLGSVYVFTRRYDEAIAQYQKALDLNPNLPVVRAHRGFAYAMKGMYPTALAEFDKIANQDKAVAPENQLVAGIVGWTYAVSGRRLDALQMAKQFKDLSSHTYVDLYFPAAIYAGLNNKDESFRLLEKAYEQHLAGILYLGIDPFFDGMRSDPRFPDLLRRMGLPQPQ
jgi:tetratricopeptide (TPR) repeat protein